MDDRMLTDEITTTLREARTALPTASPGAVAQLRRRYVRRQRRRTALATAATALVVLAIASVTGVALNSDRGWLSTAGPDGAATGTLRVWALASADRNPALRQLVERFNETADVRVELSTFVNDDYKKRLPMAGGSAEPPDVFVTWGGGPLADLVRGGEVADLTEPLRRHPEVAEAFLPRALAAGAVDGRQYGLPMNGLQPVVLFYNRGVFAEAGLEPPGSYAELLSLVDAFQARGVTPLALAGAQGWSELMYVMYLADRIGGAAAMAGLQAGDPAGWSHPAVLEALRRSQELVRRGAFGDGFDSVGYDDGQASALFAAGKAAMHLMGAWEYNHQLGNDPAFVRGGDLGWVPFPPVPGGHGAPGSLVGAQTNYFSVSSASPHREEAVEFIRTVASDAYVRSLIEGGEVPAVRDAGPKLRGTTDAAFTTFVYDLVTDAPSYALAWDQALAPSVGTALIANVRKLFALRLTPDEFAAAMSAAR